MFSNAELIHKNNSILVIGSIKEAVKYCSPEDLNKMKTISLNRDYKHWIEMGVTPNYYCTVDDSLIDFEYNNLASFFENADLQGILVTANYLQYDPNAKFDPRFLFYEQTIDDPNLEEPLRQCGLLPVKHCAFNNTSNKGNASVLYAIRYAVYLGYYKIKLLAIDSLLTETINESSKTNTLSSISRRLGLLQPQSKIKAEVASCIITYLYNNKKSHYVEQFRKLRDNFYSANLNVEIYDCSRNSILHKNAIFPYESIHITIGQSLLGAIAVPTNINEREQLIFNIWLWDQPAFIPFLNPEKSKLPELVFIFNNQTAKPLEDEIKTAFFNTNRLQKMFAGLKFIYLSLQGEDDLYRTDYTKSVGKGGYKAGPNNQFFYSMEILKDYGYYVFMMESDCVPIRPNWLGKLSDFVNYSEPFWVMGSAYRGRSRLDKSHWRHINGNAIYAVGDEHFQDFLRKTWRPALAEIVKRDPRIAYDCVLEEHLNSLKSDCTSTNPYKVWQNTAHKLRYTDYIHNISTEDDYKVSGIPLVSDILSKSPHTYIIHSKAVARAAVQLKKEAIAGALKMEKYL